MDFIKCENCNQDMCNYGIFTCTCDFIDIKNKCDICESCSYDCEVMGSFEIECSLKED